MHGPSLSTTMKLHKGSLTSTQDTRLLAEEARQGSQQLPGDGHAALAPRPGRRQLGAAGHLLLTRANVGRVADQQVNLRTSTI